MEGESQTRDVLTILSEFRGWVHDIKHIMIASLFHGSKSPHPAHSHAPKCQLFLFVIAFAFLSNYWPRIRDFTGGGGGKHRKTMKQGALLCPPLTWVITSSRILDFCISTHPMLPKVKPIVYLGVFIYDGSAGGGV